MSKSFVQQGKKKREELQLPILHFVVMDDWLPKLGEKTFAYWLKLHTLVDRTDEAKAKYGNLQTIPRSFEALYEKEFKMSKSSFYRNVIHPLWNYGLIDIAEWEDAFKIGQKPMNIIVYDYPQNSYELAVKPLEKCRDYKTEYNSNSAIFGRVGSEIRKKEAIKENELQAEIENENNLENNGFKNETVTEINEKQENVDTSNGFKNETVTVSKMKPINVSNTLFNVSKVLEEEELNNNNFEINSFVVSFLKDEMKYSDYMINDIIKHMKENKIDSFTKEQIRTQHKRMVQWVNDNKTDITAVGYFFVNGILKHDFSSGLLEHQKQLKKASATSEVDFKPYNEYPSFGWLEKSNK